MADIKIKRGSTLNLTFAFGNADGTAFSLAGVTLAMTVADPRGNLVAALQPVASATPGVATVAVASTAAWPEGLLEADLLIVSAGGDQAISQSFGIRVQRPVTQLAPDPAAYDPVLGL